jgi:UDP-glucose 4-epimerase
MQTPKTIAVTGALGHIGSHLIRRLPDMFPGCEIRMFDNFETQRYTSLFNLPLGATYRFFERDLRTAEIEPLISGCDVVVHFAAMTDAAASFESPEALAKTNFTLTERVAKACVALDIPLIMASSTSVYGTQADTIDEFCAEEELQPQSPYAQSKLAEEQFLQAMTSQGLRALIFRFGTIFGASPGMRFHTAVNKFCWQAVMKTPLTVWTTAYEQKRPYLEIDDCVRAIGFVLEKSLFDGNVYNVVSANATVRDIVELIRQHLPDTEVSFVDHRIMNTLSYDVLNTRLGALGFQPQGRLDIGISRTIELLKESNRRATS